MLVALARDLADDPQTKVVTSWDARLGPFPVKETEVVVVQSTDEANETFRRLAASTDRTLVTAPESDVLLQRPSQLELDAGGYHVE